MQNEASKKLTNFYKKIATVWWPLLRFILSLQRFLEISQLPGIHTPNKARYGACEIVRCWARR